MSSIVDGISILDLVPLIEIKLASGMSNPIRTKDIADALELIRTLKISESFADRLNPYVQSKFHELACIVANNPETE